MSEKPISPLRRRMIEEMTVRNFIEKAHNDYIRHVRAFTAFLGRSLMEKGLPNSVVRSTFRCCRACASASRAGAAPVCRSASPLPDSESCAYRLG